MEPISAALNAPLQNLLIVAGLFFFLAGLAGKISANIELGRVARMILVFAGVALFGAGFLTHPPISFSPSSSALLYRPDWTAGLNGWVEGQGRDLRQTGWSIADGQLINDGSSPSPTLLLTTRVPANASDYAVEAEIESLSKEVNSGFGIALRWDNRQGYRASMVHQPERITFEAGGLGPDRLLEPKLFDPGGASHKYRFEAKGDHLKLLIDGVVQLETTDTKYGAGQVGLVVSNAKVRVWSYEVDKL